MASKRIGNIGGHRKYFNTKCCLLCVSSDHAIRTNYAKAKKWIILKMDKEKNPEIWTIEQRN